MKKQAQVTLTILLTYYPEDFEMDDNVNTEEFENAIYRDINDINEKIEESTGLSINDIELDVEELKC